MAKLICKILGIFFAVTGALVLIVGAMSISIISDCT
jgi:hypothetical protein